MINQFEAAVKHQDPSVFRTDDRLNKQTTWAIATTELWNILVTDEAATYDRQLSRPFSTFAKCFNVSFFPNS